MSDDSTILGTPGPEVARQSGEAVPVGANPQISIQMPATGVGSVGWWWSQIDRDERVREKLVPLWKQNLRRYKGQKPNLYGINANDTDTVNIDFANTEAKKSQLCYQVPALNISAVNKADVQAVPLVQAVTNSYLLNELAAADVIDESLSDVVCPSGIAFTEIGYTAYMGKPIPQPVMEPVVDPATGQPAIDPATNQPAQRQAVDPMTGQPKTELVPNILHEKFWWEHFSPAKGIVPAFFKGTNYDQSPYLAYRFNMPLAQIQAELGTEVDSSLVRSGTDKYTLSDDTDMNSTQDMVSGIRIWYRSNFVRPDVADPRRFSLLVMIEGRGEGRSGSQVIVHKDSAYQTIDERGAYVSGMLGNPIHPLTIRYTSDSCWPASDCSMSRAVVDEICAARSMQNIQRRRSLPLHGVNTTLDTGTKQTIEKIQKAIVQGIIDFGGDPAQILKVIQPATLSQENFAILRLLREDCAEIWSLDLQPGSDGNETATKTASLDRKSETRLSKERVKVSNWIVGAAEKVFALLQQFATETQFVEILGPENAKTLVEWNKEKIGGLFRFAARPDSSIRIDNAVDREVWLRVYNMLANDPNVDRRQVIQILMEKFNQDPAMFLTAQPPQPQPEKPKVNVAIKGEDFAGPAGPTCYAILADGGIEVPDNVKTATGLLGVQNEIQQRQDEFIKHPGHAKAVETVDQHAADRSEDRPGPKVANPEPVM